MARLSSLLSRLPESGHVRMATMGHVLWVCRQQDCSTALYQTLLNYGGMQVVAEEDQSLWFFFTDDVFLALARLIIWGNFNALPACIELFPSRLQFDDKRAASLDMENSLRTQEMLANESFEVFVHPKSREGKKGLPGIDFEPVSGRQGMSSVNWAAIKVDSRMPYSSTQAWFVVVHPLGNPLDKNFQAGWDFMFKKIDGILQIHKMKSIAHENFLMVAVDNLIMLRKLLRDYLQSASKENFESGGYWPCVCVAADRKNLNFSIDLPNKIGLQWDNLMPDYPYISYRNAYLLGEGFSVKDLKYSGEQASIDNWCNVLLDEQGFGAESLPLLMAGRLMSGDKSAGEEGLNGCFYCGIQSHTAHACPTRSCLPMPPDIWERLGSIDLDDINEGFRRIEAVLAKFGSAGYGELLAGEDTAALLTQAVLANSPLSQLRHVAHYWLTRLHETESGEHLQRDDSQCWAFLESLAKVESGDLSNLEKRLAEAVQRQQRDTRLRMLQGFLHVEKNDSVRAMNAFREAASLTPLPTFQAWNEYLQARLAEESGRYSQAIEQYNQIFRVMSDWSDLAYRGIVCRVKMGFADQILDQVDKLIKEEPLWFNRFLTDPALERGHLQILTFLHKLWADARQSAEAEYANINELEERLKRWFAEEHPVYIMMSEKIRDLTALSTVKNYIAFLQIKEKRKIWETELNEKIKEEIEDLREQYKNYLTVLQSIRDEASWFPFPGVLREFSAEFNDCAGIINRAYTCNFNEAEAFRAAQAATPRMTKLLRSLKRRLKSLRMVRDATLFGLIMAKTFILLEIIGLALCFIGVPAVIYFGEYLHLGWLQAILGENQWSIQKVLIAIITITSAGFATLRSTLTFEKRREKLLEKAREQREKNEQERLERIRRQRQAAMEQTRGGQI